MHYLFTGLSKQAGVASVAPQAAKSTASKWWRRAKFLGNAALTATVVPWGDVSKQLKQPLLVPKREF